MLSFGYAIRYHDVRVRAVGADARPLDVRVPSGGLLLLLPLFATWASDIGAYAVGRTIGKHKLIPSVSPGKTVEGAIGGLLASMLVAWAYTRCVLRPRRISAFAWRAGRRHRCSARRSASRRRSAISPSRCSSARPA